VSVTLDHPGAESLERRVSGPTALGVGLADTAETERRALTVGISGFKRDASVAVCRGDSLAAVCQQERVTRVRQVGVLAGGFPKAALDAALQSAGADEADISEFVVGEPDLEPVCRRVVRAVDHHYAHAAAAFLTSGFRDATVVVCDTHGAPEVTVWRGSGSSVSRRDVPWRGPGFARVYAHLTRLLGFPSGAEPVVESMARLCPGSDPGKAADLLSYSDGALSVASGFDKYVENARRDGLTEISAAVDSVQRRLAELLLAFLHEAAGANRALDLCVGGGLFFNTYFNTAVRQAQRFSRVHIPINPGNGGVAAGAALAWARGIVDRDEQPKPASPFLGPEFTNEHIKAVLDNCKLSYSFLEDWQLVPRCVDSLARGELVGWFGGRMEWGARALGNRSILANPFAPHVLENLNRFLKRRAAYRTYGLVVCQEDVERFFEGPSSSPYMECEFTFRDPDRFAAAVPPGVSRIRVQTLTSDPSPLRNLIVAFGQQTGTPALINTSFNGFHEPIVCSPRDAVRVFYGSGLDMLVIGNFVLRK
jgi:carbamoyltransferase